MEQNTTTSGQAGDLLEVAESLMKTVLSDPQNARMMASACGEGFAILSRWQSVIKSARDASKKPAAEGVDYSRRSIYDPYRSLEQAAPDMYRVLSNLVSAVRSHPTLAKSIESSVREDAYAVISNITRCAWSDIPYASLDGLREDLLLPTTVHGVEQAGGDAGGEAQRFMISQIQYKAGIVSLVTIDAEDVCQRLEAGQVVSLTTPPAAVSAEGVPDIDYEALVRAALAKNPKWAQGTPGCVAFARGAEWFREQVAATPAATVQGAGQDNTDGAYWYHWGRGEYEAATLSPDTAPLWRRFDQLTEHERAYWVAKAAPKARAALSANKDQSHG